MDKILKPEFPSLKIIKSGFIDKTEIMYGKCEKCGCEIEINDCDLKIVEDFNYIPCPTDNCTNDICVFATGRFFKFKTTKNETGQ